MENASSSTMLKTHFVEKGKHNTTMEISVSVLITNFIFLLKTLVLKLFYILKSFDYFSFKSINIKERMKNK